MCKPESVKDHGNVALPVMDAKATTVAETSSGPLGVAKFIVNLFSTVKPRDPPSNDKTQHIRLVSIVASHFNEKVRWGLDLLEADPNNPIYYTEDAHPPAFSSFASLEATKGKASQTPVVVYESRGEKKTLYSSTAILTELCPFLYPKDKQEEILAFEENMGRRLGAALRCFAYHYLIDLPKYQKAMIEVSTHDTSKVEKVLFEKMLDKGIDEGMRKAMGICQDTSDVSEQELLKLFTEVSDMLVGDYIMDTKSKSYGFTAADLTFASLAYPLIRPDCMKDFLAKPEDLPLKLNDFSERLRSTKAGQHVLAVYRNHRGAEHVKVKSGRRDKYPWEGAWSSTLVGLFLASGVAAAGVILLQRRRN